MSSITGDRPQDAGRVHRRRPAGPSPETEAVLDAYRAAMRAELTDTLAEIRPAVGQLAMDGSVERPALERRRALWDLAVKLGRELGNAPEPMILDPGDAAPPELGGRRAGAPRLTKAQRRELGAE